MPLRWAIGMETTRAAGLSSAMLGAVLCENGARGRGHVETPPLGFEGYAR